LISRGLNNAFFGNCEQPSAALMLQPEEEVPLSLAAPRIAKDRAGLDLRALSLWRGIIRKNFLARGTRIQRRRLLAA
jgi:hypothetical protein